MSDLTNGQNRPDTNPEPARPTSLEAEVRRLREQLAERQLQYEQLRQAHDELQSERDHFHRAIMYLASKGLDLEDEEGWRRVIAEAERDPGDFAALIGYLEAPATPGKE